MSQSVFKIVGYSTTGKVTALSKPQIILARNILYIYTTMSFTGLTTEKYNLGHHCMDKGKFENIYTMQHKKFNMRENKYNVGTMETNRQRMSRMRLFTRSWSSVSANSNQSVATVLTSYIKHAQIPFFVCVF